MLRALREKEKRGREHQPHVIHAHNSTRHEAVGCWSLFNLLVSSRAACGYIWSGYCQLSQGQFREVRYIDEGNEHI